MLGYQGNTNDTYPNTLSSSIEQVMWTRPLAAVGGIVRLEVTTHFVGNHASLEIELLDQQGERHGVFEDHIYGNRFAADIRIPVDAEHALFAKAKLPAHGLEKMSSPLLLLPAIEITNAIWSQDVARRGDILTLSADVEEAPDGLEAIVTIYEHDADGAHDTITQFPTLIEGNRIEAEWEFEYHEDTDDIPTDEEAERGYQAPEYFFRVRAGGVHADSPLLAFKDWIQVELISADGEPVANAEYELTLPDGSTRTGTLDENGISREEDIPPGPIRLVFPQYHTPSTIDLS